ncbi:hypothetical protein BVRB_026350, partial [Beta vulgaris subsp. vulgaris]
NNGIRWKQLELLQMSARRDPRRRSFFDTPSSHGTADDDSDEESAVPRRQK